MSQKLKSVLICIIGIDGSGKTSVSKLLIDQLNKNALNFHYAYGRLRPILSKPIIRIGNFLYLKDQDIFRDYNSFINKKKEVMNASNILTKLYVLTILFDNILQITFKISLGLKKKNFICDRYIYDTLITDIYPYFDIMDQKFYAIINKLLTLIPKPAMTFLIDVDPIIAFKRKNDIPSLDYLSERRKLYLELAKKSGMIIINGNRSLEIITNDIFKIICRRIDLCQSN